MDIIKENTLKLFEKLYKATADAKRALELPFKMKQVERLLDRKVQEFDDKKEDAEGELQRLYIAFVEADEKSAQSAIFSRIVDAEIEIEEAARIAEVAKKVKTKLFSNVTE